MQTKWNYNFLHIFPPAPLTIYVICLGKKKNQRKINEEMNNEIRPASAQEQWRV